MIAALTKQRPRCPLNKFSLSGKRSVALPSCVSLRSFSSSASGFDAKLSAEMLSFKVAPAAGWWMRLYEVLPSQLKASGPRGYITKTDILEYISTNKLVVKKREASQPTSEKPSQESAQPRAVPGA